MTQIEYAWVVLIIGALSWVVLWELHFFLRWLRKDRLPSGRMSLWMHCVFGVAMLCLLYAFFIEPYWIEVRKFDIVTGKLRQAEFTIVQIADLHCDARQRTEEEIVRRVNALDPDVIVFTGDAINTPSALPAFKSVLRRLKARLGKVAVRGNWDVWYWKGLDLFGDTGFRELGGRAEVFVKNGEKIVISGLDPEQSAGRDVLASQLSPDIYNVFLFHYPWIVEEIGILPVDLVLAGHIHGGQVAMPFYGAVVTMSPYGKKYESGTYHLAGGRRLYVSRGIGMEGGVMPRVRFLSRPELAVFRIRPRERQ